jgi:hypothetical protein
MLDIARKIVDALIKPAPLSRQVLDELQHAWQEHISAFRFTALQ